MNVALLSLRFEICDNTDIPLYIEYYAKGIRSAGKLSYASVVSEETIPQATKDSRPFGLEEYRGGRNPTDIQIETYNSKDYNIEAIEAVVSGTSMSGEYVAAAGSDGLRQGERRGSTSAALGEDDGTDIKQDVKQEARHVAESADTKQQAGIEGEQLPLDKEKPTTSKAARSDTSPGHGARDENVVSKEGKRKTEAGSQEREIDGGVRPKSQSPTPKAMAAIHFYSGNPMVEKVKGILHIYKDNHMTTLSDDSQRSELICMLGVPAKYTIHDLLKFNGPCLKGIEYMRIIRDSSPNQYMVLAKFSSQTLADEYYMAYNNTAFNSIESDICHLVYVGQVEMLKESENACMPVPGMTELPNCPVCLERMDESVDGILTILCNHAFHMECLSQWFDTSCPVCRYCQTPEEVVDNRCMKCGSQESLWICLICGNIGCGRYVGKHAYRHFQETQHTYAMELGNNKVWDYIGDNYVHRLVQNKSDGKLVQVDEGGNPVQEEKLDALNLEYTYLLTNQLESQRLYFEEKMQEVEKTVLGKVHLLEEENLDLAESCSKLHCTVDHVNKEKHLTEKKCTHLQSRLKKVLHDLQEEKEINKGLLNNQDDWKKRVTSLETTMRDFQLTKDQEIQDLREQLRDVMFYVEAQGQLKQASGISQAEIQDGQVIMGEASGNSQNKHSRRKKQR